MPRKPRQSTYPMTRNPSPLMSTLQSSAQPELDTYVSEITKPEERDRGFLPAFKRGFGQGVSGILTGQERQEMPQDEDFIEHLGSLLGQFTSDIPGIAAGSLGGGVAGTPVPFVGSAVGSTIGAFALPELINQSYNEYLKAAKSDSSLTFGEYIEAAGRVAAKGTRAGATGLFTGKLSQALPYLKHLPGFTKLLSTRAGTAAAETGVLTAAQSLAHGELPSGQQVIDNAALVFAPRVGGFVGNKAKKAAYHIPGVESTVNQSLNKGGEALRTAAAKAYEYVPEQVKDLGKYIHHKTVITPGQKKFFDMLKDYVGERDAKFVESQFKWNEALDAYQKEKKFTPQELEDMMHYRQQSGNPLKEGDTYEALKERLSPNAKDFVDKVVDQHLQEGLNAWNNHPLTKKINPREGLQEIYLPGLYEIDPAKAPRIMEEVTKKFRDKNPFTNPKTFLSYMDAYKAYGLKPRYNNIIDLMRAYDQIMIKSLKNTELLNQIKQVEQDTNTPLIVNPNNRNAYNKAREAGYVQFDDPFLRKYVAGTKEVKAPMEQLSEYLGISVPELKEMGISMTGGAPELIHATNKSPALVHPDFAEAFHGVFNKEAYKNPHILLKAYDALTHAINRAHVFFSPFHYGALIEHARGIHGGIEGLRLPTLMQRGRALRNNKEFMMDAARSGVTFHRPTSDTFQKGKTLLDRSGADANSITGKTLTKISKGANYLFDEFQPNLKAMGWQELTDQAIKSLEQQGVELTPELLNKTKRETAQLVNNIYGGQKWDTMKMFNNPRARRWLGRAIGFPDWTTSAIRSFADMFAPGTKGEVSRNYWLKYGLTMLTTQAAIKLINSGLEQTDPEGSITGIRWNPEKAFEDFRNGDPSKMFQFSLPDVPVKIAGYTINPGRSSQFGKNRRTYGHFGKSALEIRGWFDHPLSELFNKSNPIIQQLVKQLTGVTPSKKFGEYFSVDPLFRKSKEEQEALGKQEKIDEDRYGKPFQGTSTGTPENIARRAITAGKDLLPYGSRNLLEGHPETYVGSLGGAFPVTHGLGLTQSEPYIKDSLERKDLKRLNQIVKTLRDNGYSDKAIKTKISIIRNKLKKK